MKRHKIYFGKKYFEYDGLVYTISLPIGNIAKKILDPS